MRNSISLAIGAVLFSLLALPATVAAQQKTVKACEDEWRANKADNQAKGITEKAYVAQCRGGTSAAQPSVIPSTTPTASPAATAPAASGKTVSACRAEWQANKGAYQSAGITEKAYVDKCRAGEAVAVPNASPSTPAASAPPASAPAAPPPAASAATSGKTAKACQEEWRANKAGYQAAGITEKAYVEKCRAGETVALPTTPAPAPTAAPPTPAPATPAAVPSQPATRPAAKPTTTAVTPAPTGAGQFATEAEAKSRCPADIVVWVNLNSKIYHFAGYKNYGTTEHGAYMCEKQATTDGFRASKNEKRPGV
jgi:hypothetical protein